MLQNVAAAATKSSKKSSSKIEWYVLLLEGVILGVGAGMPVGAGQGCSYPKRMMLDSVVWDIDSAMWVTGHGCTNVINPKFYYIQLKHFHGDLI